MNKQILTLPFEIIVRKSTDTVASKDRKVVQAITFFRENSLSNKIVNDVVKATFLSKRRLYTRFKAATAHSINREIQLVKLFHFKKLLRESQKSISEISYQLGFEDVTHISRWFKSLEKISPTQWKTDNGL